jgi:PIN domain nuclease of toxin-antitoxin system
MVAYLSGESGASVVEAILQDPDASVFAHSINLCEVYYHFLRHSDEAIARQAIDDLLAAGVIERPDMARDFWIRVGQHKARGGISLADCFCLALAQELSGRIVTSDHGEFTLSCLLGSAQFCLSDKSPRSTKIALRLPRDS